MLQEKIGESTKNLYWSLLLRKASWKVTIHVPASGMKFWFSDQVQQVTNNNEDWSRYGEIDPDSIRITGTDKYYYHSEIDGRKTTGIYSLEQMLVLKIQYRLIKRTLNYQHQQMVLTM